VLVSIHSSNQRACESGSPIVLTTLANFPHLVAKQYYFVSPAEPRMRKILKLLGFLSVTLILFFIVATLAFYHLLRIGEFRRFLISEIETRTTLQAQLGAADLEIGWITGIVFRDLTLTEPEATKPAITAARIMARVALMPLLHQQIVIYEIRVQKPTVHFVRDEHGRLALLDKLLNLPFFKQQDSEFSLDLRSLKVEDGDIGLTDQKRGAEIGDWRLVDADLSIERLRGQRLRELLLELLKRPQAGTEGAALAFNLNGAVLRDNAKMNVRARGRLAFPGKNIELQQARWDGDLQLVNFPAALIKNYLGARLPIRSMSGYLAQRVHVAGNPESTLRLKGDLEFRQLELDAPELFLTPLAGADGRATFELDWTRQHLQLKRADVRADNVKFSLQADIAALDGDDPRIRLNLTGLSAPAAALPRYLPLKILGSPRLEKAILAIQAGQVEIKQAAVNATLSELRHMPDSGGKSVRFEGQLRDVATTLPAEGALPLRNVDGQIKLTNGVLAVNNLKAIYGNSRFNDIDGTYDFSPGAVGKFDLQARGDVNLAELKEQFKYDWFPLETAKVASSIQELGGRAKIDLRLRRLPAGPIQFEGKATLDNARIRYDRYALSELHGEVAFTPKEIKGENIRAQLGGSPLQIQLSLKDYGSDNGQFDLAVESPGIKAGLVSSLLLDTGSPQDPGLVRGSVRYWGPFGARGGRKFTGELDVVNAQLLMKPLLQPLRELSGRIKIDETGIDFQNLKTLLVGVPASASGRWRYAASPQLMFDFNAPNLDITYLASQIDPESSEFYANLVARGKIALGKGRIKNFDFSDLKTDATIDHRVWRLTNLTAHSAGGAIHGVTTIFDRPETLGVASEPRIQNAPIQAFLNWFGTNTAEMTGKVNLTGKLETDGKNDAERKQNLNGAFNLRIDDGTINRMRIVVQILNLLDLSRWFTLQMPDLAKQGIRFRAITGDFKVTKGVYSTENLIVDSSDLRMTGVGKIDVPKDEVDFIIAVRPFAGIDSAMSYIPLLGRSIAAIKNSFLVASFNITGRIDDPTITPAPLGTLSEWFWGVLGIPKNIIGFGEGEKNEPAKDAPGAPVK
jgi:uncharacterized protein YhdP